MSPSGYLVLALVIVVLIIAGYTASLLARKRKLQARLAAFEDGN